LKLATNSQLKTTLDKLKKVYNESSNEQEYILVLIYHSKEELNDIQFTLKSMGMSEHKNIIFINAERLEDVQPSDRTVTLIEKSMKIVNTNFENGYALIIGVGKDLPVTVDDATAVFDVLVNPHRAAYPLNQVKLLTEKSADRVSILKAFDDLVELSNKDSNATVVIYYSGHGGVINNSGNISEYFLVPNNYEPSKWKQTVIFGNEFIEKVRAIKANKMLILLDCCHAGGVPTPKDVNNNIGKFIKSPAPSNLADVLSEGTGQVMIASSRENESSYTDNPYSIFTICLLEALSGKVSRNNDGYARILDVIAYLLEQVPLRASGEQHPFISQINSLSENFPICFYDGGNKSMSLLKTENQKTSLTDTKRKRLKTKLEGLQSSWDIQNEKLNKIRESMMIETNPSIKYQREKEVSEATAELSKLDFEIDEIEKQLKNS
jgi:Caspase domain